MADLRKLLEDDFKTERKASLIISPSKFEYKNNNMIANFEVKSKDPKTGSGKGKQYDPFFTTVNVLFS